MIKTTKHPYDEKAVEMYLAGVTQTKIKEELGISSSQIYAALERNNIPLKHPERAIKREHSQKKGARKCPHCKTNKNPAGARFCCMCGKDIRSEEDLLIEQLERAFKTTCAILPLEHADEVNEAIMAAIQYIKSGAKARKK